MAPGIKFSFDLTSNKTEQQDGVLSAFSTYAITSLLWIAFKLFPLPLFTSLFFEHKSYPQIIYA